MGKERVDVLVVRQGLANSREKAKRYIMAGQIYNEKHERLDKPGEKIADSSILELKGEDMPYVSRGGLKLVKARDCFGIDFKDLILLDIGSSTGGFTDVALQSGAKQSYALDVGTNQLDWKLRSDDRVIVMEQTNFRHAKPEDFDQGQPDLASIDVSFISLALILPPLVPILKESGRVIALIKPQFEAGRDQVGKKGIVRDPKVHLEVLERSFEMAQGLGYDILNLTYSPITGGSGNIEFLALLENSRRSQGKNLLELSVEEVVQAAHEHFHA
ncbi:MULTISPECIES: TlyA family RNA methyltransferase [Aerococcus]|uniref:TlyA family RNA methyltransferase n=1 Tax=Aerococcus sanguinicola TaxID=119206 RepID=A0A5N1GTW8_9LACT|nr:MULTISPECIES: TlyA family RNA methyltransferase [Aerococcus]KAA9302030.1 TlyA family RNA methyltransferase [Aerococcus sanguinicola]MDK6368546.1 TlyA family RNA methyltransferase [Aerococcus sp. UMB9870]MDK6686473.1 TlyA family RNA methyltransferase [Aerococcus sp. UMB8623]OFK21606.1 cell division protein FtsJ [Aerococcus sp. HMSC072A12]OFR34143.1 cell division protein FtsJ [Aerococcus sp. HMSC061A03]